MLRKLNLLLFAVLSVALLPTVAEAGDGVVTGACYVVSGEGGGTWPAGDAGLPDGAVATIAGCADGFTEAQCSSVDELVLFSPGSTCADLANTFEFDWNGSCSAAIDPVGDVCILLWTAQGPVATAAVCENEIGGSWFTDLECGGTPVPTVPPVGLAALAMLMLAAALVVLSLLLFHSTPSM